MAKQIQLMTSFKHILLAAVLVVLATLNPCKVQAGFVTAFSGNSLASSQFPDHTGINAGSDVRLIADGTINFAVVQNLAPSLATWTTLLGFDPTTSSTWDNSVGGANTFDTSAKYLYVYQVVNNGPGTSTLERFTTNRDVPTADLTSFGYFAGVSLKDDNNNNVSTTNSFGNPDNPTNADFGSATGQAVANLGVTNPGFSTGNPGLRNPGNLDTGDDVSVLRFLADFTGSSHHLVAGQTSSVFGFTTNDAPRLDTGSLQDGASANGTDATPTTAVVVPEPPAFALLSFGAVGFASLLIRIRKSLMPA